MESDIETAIIALPTTPDRTAFAVSENNTSMETHNAADVSWNKIAVKKPMVSLGWSSYLVGTDQQAKFLDECR